MNNWLEYFPENVLERGYSYHLNRLLQNLLIGTLLTDESFALGMNK
ncbi:hypothetical protein EfmJHP10_28190 [Enterococcus faecium]|nr:hypothetical protein EfmJHP10_28190 [Enterococcus faecium]